MYVLLGSLSGTAPGFDLGAVHVPIDPDLYTHALLAAPNPVGTFEFRNIGQLDAAGSAVVMFRLPALSPALVGLTLHHAAVYFAANGTATAASNSVQLCLRP